MWAAVAMATASFGASPLLAEGALDDRTVLLLCYQKVDGQPVPGCALKRPLTKLLRAEGGYSRLRTTFPCLSPVAWSCFATGANPAKHNIFGFLSRNAKTYVPELSSSVVRPPSRVLEIGKLQIPLGRPEVEMKRKSVPFWKLLGDHDILLGWAAIISVTMLLSLVPAFLGLIFTLPILGHTTWHLYQQAVSPSEG